MSAELQKRQETQDVSIPTIIVDTENPLTFTYGDSNLAFFIDSKNCAWAYNMNSKSFAPLTVSDIHPMHHQNLTTGEIPQATTAERKQFTNILDAGIYANKIRLTERLTSLKRILKDSTTSEETKKLASESIPEIEEFISEAQSLENTKDEAQKLQIREKCIALLNNLDTN